MATFKTPGVYVVERNAFPNSVVEAPTGIPLFVGHTHKAENSAGETLTDVPTRVTSLMQFTQFFGGAPETKTSFEDGRFGVSDKGYYLWRAIRMFYANGGGPCWIMSVGSYNTAPTARRLSSPFQTNSEAEKTSEPDLVVIPDALMLSNGRQVADVYKAALVSNGRLQDKRFVIMDVPDGARGLDEDTSVIDTFRGNMGNDMLAFAAAYYPWVHTSLETRSSLRFCDESAVTRLTELVAADLPEERATAITEQINDAIAARTAALGADPVDPDAVAAAEAGLERANAAAEASSPGYAAGMRKVLQAVNLQPASGAVAGVYTRTDTSFGVFKAPANTGILNVTEPAAQISNDQQAELNVPMNGKAVNAIRSFVGRGVLIWGARTMDGNSADWRYVSVRRTLLMMERSIRASCEAYVFEPNTAQTWVTIKSMISNFLTNQWKAGALAGAKPEDAFSVRIGLGETMTADDINSGMLKVEIAVAVTRPAEFIVLTFQQQMQTS